MLENGVMIQFEKYFFWSKEQFKKQNVIDRDNFTSF